MWTIITPWNWDEKYVSGPYKGDYKLTHQLIKITPFASQIRRLSNIEERNKKMEE